MQKIRYHFNQGLLIELMRKLGYEVSNKGICYGIANMGMQAILADDIDTFVKRSDLLYQIKEANLPIYSLVKYTKTRAAKQQNLTELDKLILDIPAFFDGILIYQSTNVPSELHSDQLKIAYQDTLNSLPLASSLCFDKDKIVQSGVITGVYDIESLKKYFNSLNNIIKKNKINYSFAFIICDQSHAIAVGYEPSSDLFFLIDGNDFPGRYYLNGHDMAYAIFNAFDGNDYIVLVTSIFVKKSNEKKFKLIFNEWKDNESNIFNPNNIKLTDDNSGISWLFMAAHEGQFDTVKWLLENGADPNQPDAVGFTPLYAAIDHNHADIVKLLLAYNASPFKTTNKFIPSYFDLADSLQHYSCIKELNDGIKYWPIRQEIAKLSDDSHSARQFAIDILKKNAHTLSINELKHKLSEFHRIEKLAKKIRENNKIIDVDERINHSYQAYAKNENITKIIRQLDLMLSPYENKNCFLSLFNLFKNKKPACNDEIFAKRIVKSS